jgi:hypothetical protein
VDHRVELTQSIDLFGNSAHVADFRQIANDCGIRTRRRRQRYIGTRLIAPMHHDTVAQLEQQLGGHQAEPGRRSGYENACHGGVLLSIKPAPCM